MQRSACGLLLARVVAVSVLVMGLLLAACGRAQPPPAGAGPGALPAARAADPGAAAARVSEGGQVTVSVTWAGPDAGLVFDVAMDTHSVNLDAYDLRELAVLQSDGGLEVLPTGWDAPPGGHHRAGTLTFPPAAPDGTPVLGPGVRGITLILRNIAGVPERTLTWTW